MKPRKFSVSCRSFEDLRTLIDEKKLPRLLSLSDSLSKHPDAVPVDATDARPELDEELYAKAMEDVIPIERDNYVERVCRAAAPKGFREKEDLAALSKLIDLIKYGKGFNVSDTPEYIEGTGYQVHPAVAKRLHHGDYSIEAHVDLHGHNVETAKEIFETFLRWAVFGGKKGVLIVHGRGLCSPSEPVLKKKVEEWLTRGPWRKWVVAYSSARICDGGAGATYVLLRERPVSKRFKLRKRFRSPVSP